MTRAEPSALDFLVGRQDLTRVEWQRVHAPKEGDLAPGHVALALSRFALTANNITYARCGESLGYWQYFPAPDGWGRIPVWGIGAVTASRVPAIEHSLASMAIFPISTHPF